MTKNFKQEKTDTIRIASIDIGTNTILLLIAEIKNDELITLVEEFRIPRIGKSLSDKKIIPKDSEELLLKVLEEYLKICKNFYVEKIICFGTAPFRMALNADEVISNVHNKLGIKIKVLTSSDEALLTYLGGISNFKEFFEKKNFVVIDIGGGSTEIVYGNFDEIKFQKSYNIGAVILKDKLFSSFPYEFEINKVISFLEKIFVDEFNFKNFITIGVAGTPTTIAAIKIKSTEFNAEKIDKKIIKTNYLHDLIRNFYKLSPEEILQKYPEVYRGREDVILPGTIILYFLLMKLKANEFYVSTRGIRYGAIVFELMNYNEGFWTKVGLKKFLSSLNG